MQLLKLFHKFLVQTGCIPVGSRVLVAVSGGADSVALLSLLHSLPESMSLHLEVAHLDHSLRESSPDDALFVEKMCLDLGVPFVVKRIDVAEIAKQRKGNLEEVARDVRRDFLEMTARARGCSVVAYGHHADDQAETFLLRLLRGSRLTGLSGMKVVNGSIVRPLLSFTRSDLVAYLQEEGLLWREDESNRDQAFTRNRIRYSLLPALEEFNPRISRHLAGLCEQMRADGDYWDDLVAREIDSCGRWSEGSFILDRLRLLELPSAVTARLVRASLQLVRGDLRGISATHTADVLNLVDEGPPQGELNLPGVLVARRYDDVVFRTSVPEALFPFSAVLTALGSCPLPGGRFLRLTLEERSLGESSGAVEFAAGELLLPLHVRFCLPGDRFRPSGMNGTKKLQDFFVDLKMPKETRKGTLVLLKDDEILWLVGCRRAEGRRPVEGEPVMRIVVES